MLYKKPANKTYVQMAIEFDKEFWEEGRSDEKLYKYMYLLYYMLASKKKYFPSNNDYAEYDNFAQFSATTIYMRFIKKQQTGEKIKSILNYCKSTLYPLKIMYQNDSFNQIFDTFKPNFDAHLLSETFRENIQQEHNREMPEDIIETFETIPQITREVILDTPYRNNKLMIERLYLSCILTLLNNFTLPNKVIEKIEKTKKDRDTVLVDSFKSNEMKETILWHLNDDMRDYVNLLTNKIKDEVGKEMDTIKQSYILEDNVLDSVLNSVYENYSGEKNYEGDE